MRQVLAITAGIVLVVTVIILGFTYTQANKEQVNLASDLQSRTHDLAESLQDPIESALSTYSTSTVQRIVDRLVDREHIMGLSVFDAKGSVIASTTAFAANSARQKLANAAMDADMPQGNFTAVSTSSAFVYAEAIHDDQNQITGALVIVQNADYIDTSVREIWTSSLLRLFFQLLFFAIGVFLIMRFVLFRPLMQLERMVRSARTGQAVDPKQSGLDFFLPLSSEITKMSTSLRQARRAASEEARLRLEKIDSPWTADRLREFMKAYLKDRVIYVVSNREPYVHTKGKKGEVTWSVPASGMVTALEPVMDACGGLWIAHGSGNADKQTADKDGKLAVPPDDPKYTLKRIWLSEREVKGHYVGFSNEAIWPLCHQAHTRPIFREEDWKEYRRVNGKFAAALLAEVKHIERPLILVQDYHFALLPKMIKASRPDAQVAIFWHIPWPSAEAFSICPWRQEVLEGMLGADLIGFHTQQYCNNFMDTVGSEIEALIDLEEFTITHEGHDSSIQPFPISIAFSDTSESPAPPDREMLSKLGITTERLVLGVDRLDYIKGILERLKGYEFLLETHPEYREHVTLLQIAPPSREAVEKYREYEEAVTRETARINERFGTREWKPIVLEKRHYTHAELTNLYRLADACLVTSLHDGMNLVAKEYAAARTDEAGVLILSPFTGAARDLKGALIVNPYSAEQMSSAIATALTMPPTEQHRRMKTMRTAVRDYNVYRWSAELIKALVSL